MISITKPRNSHTTCINPSILPSFPQQKRQALCCTKIIATKVSPLSHIPDEKLIVLTICKHLSCRYSLLSVLYFTPERLSLSTRDIVMLCRYSSTICIYTRSRQGSYKKPVCPSRTFRSIIALTVSTAYRTLCSSFSPANSFPANNAAKASPVPE